MGLGMFLQTRLYLVSNIQATFQGNCIQRRERAEPSKISSWGELTSTPLAKVRICQCLDRRRVPSARKPVARGQQKHLGSDGDDLANEHVRLPVRRIDQTHDLAYWIWSRSTPSTLMQQIGGLLLVGLKQESRRVDYVAYNQ